MFKVIYNPEKEIKIDVNTKKKELDEYFKNLRDKVLEIYNIAKKAREKGFDPKKDVEIYLAFNRIQRINALMVTILKDLKEFPLEEKIKELESEYGVNDWRVALKIAEEVAKWYYNEKKVSLEKAIENGLRVGLAYVTMGIVTAPIEGIIGVKLKNRLDGKGKYLAVYGAGPIRAAGGTAAALVAIIADYLRIVFNLPKYDPTKEEIERYILEVEEYNKARTLQYMPYPNELRIIVSNLPIEINGLPGEATGEREVPGYRDLPRVETNKIREGMVLLLAEGLAQKAKKIVKKLKKWGKEFKLDYWIDILEKAINERKRIMEEEEKKRKSLEVSTNKVKSSIPYIPPDKKYLEKIVAGRPILSDPLAKGGFRLRYGRARTSGMSAAVVHSATMYIVDEFLAIGTQIALERPGKGAIVTPSQYIEGPIVKLKDGSVIRVEDSETAKKIRRNIDKILFLGDILFPVGEFKQQGHFLVPSPWVEEWYALILKEKLDKGEIEEKDKEIIKEIVYFPWKKIDEDLAIYLSKKYKIPLHPRYTYFWHDISKEQVKYLFYKLKNYKLENNNLYLENDSYLKFILEEVCIPHKYSKDRKYIIVEEGKALLFTFNLLDNNWEIIKNRLEENYDKAIDAIDLINKISPVEIKVKAPVYVGVRVGRPEKSKIRELKGKPNVLFPVGRVTGGKSRDLIYAIQKYGYVEAEIPVFICPKCGNRTIYPKCEKCGAETIQYRICPKCGEITREKVCPKCKVKTKYTIETKFKPHIYLEIAEKRLGVKRPEKIRGVKGMSSKKKIPELLDKGILRALYGLTVNKDGTIRFDAIEAPITHFKPREIGVSIEKLKELGYTHDIYGNPLEKDDQILELKPQDIIIPDPPNLDWTKSAAEVFVKVANFIDDLLEKVYNLPRFYNIKTKEDLVGHIIFVLAPHTSSAVVARVIGFTKGQVVFAHPALHAGIRRNCDGDELSIFLGLDAFLNFSREYLPAKRGGFMDAPIVLTVNLELEGIDTEAHDLDVVPYYPKEVYEKSWNLIDPTEVKVERLEDRIGKINEWFDHWFTIDNGDINDAPIVSAYKRLNSMVLKVAKVIELAEKIRAVDENRVAELVVDGHFLKDVKGNLRKFGMQAFRCIKCNEKYRRWPLTGKCPKCGGDLVLTVSEGFVLKYLNFAVWLVNRYKVDPYLKQSVELVESRVKQLFGKGKKTSSLDKFVKKAKEEEKETIEAWIEELKEIK